MDTVVKSMLDEDPEDEKKVMNNIINLGKYILKTTTTSFYNYEIVKFIILTQNTYSFLSYCGKLSLYFANYLFWKIINIRSLY